MKMLFARLMLAALTFPQIGRCVPQTDQSPTALGRCTFSGVEYQGENVCHVSFSGLISHAESLNGKVVQVSGVLALLYDLPVLVRFSPKLGLNDSLDTIALSGPWVGASSQVIIRRELAIAEQIEVTLRKLGHVPVSLIGRFHLGAEPSLANMNLGTIEVFHLDRNSDSTKLGGAGERIQYP